MDEQAFLDAIAARPSDRVQRLIYADWLEEQGDPRAEVLRITEQIRGLRPWDPQIAGLMRRRSSLMAGVSPEWTQALQISDADGSPCWLTQVPQTLDDWWSLYDALAARWLGPTARVDSNAEALVRAFEQMDLALPRALAEWHRRVGAGSDLVRPHLLRTDRQRDSIQVYESSTHHSLASIAIRLSDVYEDDPPVYSESQPPTVWPSLSQFAFGRLMRQIRLKGRTIYPTSTHSFVRQVASRLSECAIPLNTHAGLFVRCFEGNGLLVWMSGSLPAVHGNFRVSEVRKGQFEEFLRQ